MQALQILGKLQKNTFIMILNQHTEPGIISMSEHVSGCISAGITSSAGMDNYLESLFDADITSILPPSTSSSTALTFFQDLTHYFHALQFLLFHQ